MRRSPHFVLVRRSGPLALAAAIWFATPALATHDARRFELDANAFNGSASGEDWNVVAPVDRSTSDIVASFVRDAPAPLDRSYFTGGGSKDLNDVPDWAYTPSDVAPDKNEITNAFAVAYRSARDTGRTNVGDLLFFFGLDRFANNGDAQVGFWFFRSSVGLQSGGAFSGRHRVGDILVLSHFTQGGRISDVNVYSWVGSGGSEGSLDLIAGGRECAGAPADDPVCAAVNRTNVSSAWSYVPKSGPAGTYASGSFFEAGINVSRLVPGVECWSSFMAETRTSQSVTAQLKDLVLGPFDTCPVTTASVPDPSNPFGAPGGPDLPATGGATGPLAVAGFALLALGIAARSAGEHGMRAARTAAVASLVWRRFDSRSNGCSSGTHVRNVMAPVDAIKRMAARRSRR